MSTQRTVVITGSASGIGAATAQLAREQGDRVIGVDLRDADVIADLSTPEGRTQAAEKAIAAAEGRIDAVIACAGIAAPIPKTLSINYFGVVELLQALRPTLAESAAPRVVAVSSMASLQPAPAELVEALLAGDEALALERAEAYTSQDQQTAYAVYPASKRALSRWLRRAAVTDEWAGAGIPLNAVAPGTVLTPMTKELLATEESRAFVDQSVPMPLNYHQPPESVASLLLFLASPATTHTTGQTVYCDGGADAVLRGDDIWSWNDPQPQS